MKKMILLVLVIFIMLPISGFISVLSVVSAGSASQAVMERTCEHSSGTFRDEEVERQREAAKKNITKPEYVNAVLGVYYMDKTKDIKMICDRMNELIEYVAVHAENNRDMTVPVYLQAFQFGTGYIDHLIQIQETYTLLNALEYQEHYENEYSEDMYQYALRVLTGISDTCALGVGGLPLDKDSYTVTSGFPYREDGSFHAGLDMGVSYGSNVYAVNDAVVLMIGTSCSSDGGSLGNTCGYGDIQGAGNFVLYQITINEKAYVVLACHMSQVFVKPGEKLLSGQQIGLSGNSGNSSGAHLHLELHSLSSTSEDERLQESISSIGTDRNLISPCAFINGLCSIEEK